jgi:hypothetical protein
LASQKANLIEKKMSQSTNLDRKRKRRKKKNRRYLYLDLLLFAPSVCGTASSLADRGVNASR